MPASLRATLLLALVGCSAPSQGYDEVPIDTDVTVDAHGAIAGRVEGGGAGIAGAHVTTTPHGYEATTDAAGRFTLSRLDPGPYALLVAAEGWATAEVAAVDVVEGEITDAPITLEPALGGARVRVRAIGPDGEPLVDALVSASSGETATTDTAGEATLEGLAAGEVDVTVADAAGALWPRTARALHVVEDALVDVDLQLAGRAAAGSTWVGTATCSACHSDIAPTLAATAHARTLSTTIPEPLRSLFAAGTSVALPGGRATLSLDGTIPEVEIRSDGGERRTFAIAGLLGDPRSASVPFTELGDQAYPLPFAWRAADARFPLWPDVDAALVPWEASTWLDGVDFAFVTRPDPSLSADARCIPCHATGFDLSARSDGGVDLTPAVTSALRWGEGGVGCERCHGLGSSHFRSTPEDKKFRITRADQLDPDLADDVCGQCHAMTEGEDSHLPYPFSSDAGLFHPGRSLGAYATSTADLWPSGAAASPGAQADELAASPHGGAGVYRVRCIDCHDPHGAAVDGGGLALPAMLRADHRDNALCASCHLGLTFADDADAMKEHWNHTRYEPSSASMRGRCTECHMPETAARVGFHEGSGAGDLASHLFLARPPQDALDAFDAVRLDTLPLGSFPVEGCARCHAWNTFVFGGFFPGPTGDLTRRAIHEDFQQAFEEKFP